MSLIQMVDGKQFVVKEKVAEVMELFGTSTPQGRGVRPRRPGESEGPTFIQVTVEKTPVYLNVDHISFVTEQTK